MSANSNLNEALGLLDEKLQSLNAMTRANQFMIDALRDHPLTLKALDADGARAFLRQSARAKFADDAASRDILTVLEQLLAPRQSAKIIPFPARPA
ncbi:hypothetical protein [Parasedimentitalea psychrophila]|uniref:Uncharacterized protein n=1 Tax=Parasedimentitalea psychrophila TaxID=2997337 RepID=A0A9Y2KWJ1_9RHOB|nr:hypothetical protein [Parasedimentitalea psychrophila]WIY23829.1 hypothetical protein QPJ95_14400 [Parasedimentitalea psychrophila]